jgi:hypothetical protein
MRSSRIARKSEEVRRALAMPRPDPGTTSAELLGRVYRDHVPSAEALELHDSVNVGEKSVVVPTAHVATRVEARAALANQDATSTYRLSAETLDAEAAGIAVATVATRAYAFLVCHMTTRLSNWIGVSSTRRLRRSGSP